MTTTSWCETVWLRPRAALEMYWAGRMMLAPPQIMSLAHLRAMRTAQERAGDSARLGSRADRAAHLRDRRRAGGVLPGRRAPSGGARALPGPSRLIFRNRRFEPFGGFESLFD